MSKESKLAFLRQSGWVALATTIGGAASYAVHIFAKDMPKADYGVFTTLLQLINLLAIPAIGLQAVFAQKSAETATSNSQVKLMEERCAIVIVVIVLWIAANIISVIYGENLVQNYNLGSSEAPKITPHIPAMKENIATALGIAADAVGIKATTNEAMGFVGRGEGMAAHAVASVELPD